MSININKLKLQIANNIFNSYTRQGFGKLLKSEIDLIMFDFSLKMIFADCKPSYFYDEELNYFMINKQDIYMLSKKLKITETKIKSFIEQIGLINSLLDNDELALNSFITLFKKQKQDKTLLEEGKLRFYVPNKLLKNYLEAKIDENGSIPNYTFNNDILEFDIFVLFALFDKKEEDISKWIKSQNNIINDDEIKKIQKNLTKEKISLTNLGKEASKTLLSKFIGKSGDMLVDRFFEFLSGKK